MKVVKDLSYDKLASNCFYIYLYQKFKKNKGIHSVSLHQSVHHVKVTVAVVKGVKTIKHNSLGPRKRWPRRTA